MAGPCPYTLRSIAISRTFQNQQESSRSQPRTDSMFQLGCNWTYLLHQFKELLLWVSWTDPGDRPDNGCVFIEDPKEKMGDTAGPPSPIVPAHHQQVALVHKVVAVQGQVWSLKHFFCRFLTVLTVRPKNPFNSSNTSHKWNIKPHQIQNFFVLL